MISNCYRIKTLVGVVILTLIVGLFARSAFAARNLDDQIAQARRDWLVGLATEKRIAEELAQYQASDTASPEVVQLYETYLDRVQRLTEEKRLLLEQLEQQDVRAPAGASGAAQPTAKPAYNPQVPEDQELDELSALNQQLNRSLAAFDDMLLREIEQSRVQSDLKMKQLAREAAQAKKALGKQGQMEGSAESKSGMQEGQSSDGAGNETGQMDKDRQGAQRDAAGAMGDMDKKGNRKTTGEGTDLAKSQNKKQKGSEAGGKEPPSGDENISSQDDDIVARQLREAAENETDPELKAKLWKEYRDYKRSL
jgi:hypothetical protein